MKKDRFDLENDIMEVWAIKDLISTLTWRMFDHAELMNEDNIMNHLHAIETVLDLRCKKLNDTFEQVFQLNDYAPDYIKEERAKMLKHLEEQANKEDFPAPKTKKKGKK